MLLLTYLAQTHEAVSTWVAFIQRSDGEGTGRELKTHRNSLEAYRDAELPQSVAIRG